MKKVLGRISVKDNEEEVMNIVRRLVTGEWFTTKIAGVSLIPTLFPQVSTKQQEELLA